MANPSKVVGAFWFTEHDGRSFGIVKVQTSDGLRFYIGHAKGADEKTDTSYIHKYGSPLNTDQLANFISEPKIAAKQSCQKIQPKSNYHEELLGAMFIGIALGLIFSTYFM